MSLSLQRPLVVFDLETTGINTSTDRIVEIAYIKVYPDGRRVSRSMRVNPGMPIPPESTLVHGISDADVEGLPSFADVAHDVYEDFRDADVCGFNSDRFDLPLLAEELLRCGVAADFSKTRCIDVQTIYHKMEPRTLSAAVGFYCGDTHEGAHSALADTEATLRVLEAQMEHYGDKLPHDVDSLAEFARYHKKADLAGRIIYNDKDEEVINFGKYNGRVVADVLQSDPAFYAWVMQGDFPLNTKQVLTKIKLRLTQGNGNAKR